MRHRWHPRRTDHRCGNRDDLRRVDAETASRFLETAQRSLAVIVARAEGANGRLGLGTDTRQIPNARLRGRWCVAGGEGGIRTTWAINPIRFESAPL